MTGICAHRSESKLPLHKCNRFSLGLARLAQTLQRRYQEKQRHASVQDKTDLNMSNDGIHSSSVEIHLRCARSVTKLSSKAALCTILCIVGAHHQIALE